MQAGCPHDKDLALAFIFGGLKIPISAIGCLYLTALTALVSSFGQQHWRMSLLTFATLSQSSRSPTSIDRKKQPSQNRVEFSHK
jgi:hypothetical protein